MYAGSFCIGLLFLCVKVLINSNCLLSVTTVGLIYRQIRRLTSLFLSHDGLVAAISLNFLDHPVLVFTHSHAIGVQVILTQSWSLNIVSYLLSVRVFDHLQTVLLHLLDGAVGEDTLFLSRGK
jgi:nitrogen fixation protein